MSKVQTGQHVVDIVFCMGSSCFSRGGNRGLAMLQSYLKENNLERRVHVRGKLCEGQCQDGPNITIDGKSYHTPDPGVVLDLVKHHLGVLNS